MTEPSLLREVRDQPRLLRRLDGGAGAELCERVAAWRRGDAGRLLLVGCGDMRFAATAAAAVATGRTGREVRAVHAMDLRWLAPSLRPSDLVIGASISGRTPRTLEALRLAAAAGATTVAVTDAPASPITAGAGHVVVLGTAPAAELEQSARYPGYASEVPQTRTYLAALLVLIQAAQRAAGAEQVVSGADVAELLEGSLEGLLAAARARARLLVERGPVREVFVLGSGPHRATALYGAAKLLEYAIRARAQCLEELQHLELFVLEKGDWLCAVVPDAPSAARWDELRGLHEELGCGTFEWRLLDHLPAAETAAAALFPSAVALQLQALALAEALGRDVEQWVGGVRRERILRLSRRAVRGLPADP